MCFRRYNKQGVGSKGAGVLKGALKDELSVSVIIFEGGDGRVIRCVFKGLGM